VPAAIRVVAPARVSLTEARRRANFTVTVVPPAGLPHDVVSRTVFTAARRVLEAAQRVEHRRRAGDVHLRARRRPAFDIIAHRYSALSAPAARYVYDADALTEKVRSKGTVRR
jgi:hypothetical protein